MCYFSFKPTRSVEMALLKQHNKPQNELLSRFWTDVRANLSLLSSLVSLYLPSLHSSSPVSCVHLCLQTRLQWRICGRSMSACLTLWCISTGLNPLSITLFRASFPFSVPLSIASFLSVSHSQWWDIAWLLGSVMEDTPTNMNWAQNFQLQFHRGSSEVVHLTFWPNAGQEGPAQLCKTSVSKMTTPWFNCGCKSKKVDARGNAVAQVENLLFCVHSCCI